MIRTTTAALAAVLALAAPAMAQTDAPAPGRSVPLEVTTVANGLENPWGMAFLPDGTLLVTERPGSLVHVSGDGVRSVGGVPDVWASGQGGLLDVALHPEFGRNRLVYLTFSERGRGGAGTAVARGRLSGDGRALQGTEVIWRQAPKVSGGRHFGSRLVFARDGTLFVTTGDRGNAPFAQDGDATIGKLIRINDDGTVPANNPFANGRGGVRPEVYSLGHRNIQGADLDSSGRLWTVEHGARGGDELNRPQAGRNYGWPTITYGRDYSGARIGIGQRAEGLEQPVYHWDPSIAPSGLAVVDSPLFPEWRGNILVGALRDQHVSRLVLDGTRVTAEEVLFDRNLGRIRDLEFGPDGALYILTDAANGALHRVTPRGEG